MKKHLGELLLLIATIIYGTSYVSLNTVSIVLDAFTANTCRYLLGFLTVFIFLFKKDDSDIKTLFKAGFIIGGASSIAAYFQQSYINTTSIGKVGFLTSMYIIVVPIIAFILERKKLTKQVIISIILATIGLFVLSDLNNLSLRSNDLKLLLIPLFFGIEIYFVSYYASKVNPIKLTAFAFIFCTLFNAFFAFAFEKPSLNNIVLVLPSLIYMGIFASGLAYVLQFIGQKTTDPTIASLIMALESVISAVSGYFFLNQLLSIREIIGCAIMLIAIIICELPSE